MDITLNRLMTIPQYGQFAQVVAMTNVVATTSSSKKARIMPETNKLHGFWTLIFHGKIQGCIIIYYHGDVLGIFYGMYIYIYTYVMIIYIYTHTCIQLPLICAMVKTWWWSSIPCHRNPNIIAHMVSAGYPMAISWIPINPPSTLKNAGLTLF